MTGINSAASSLVRITGLTLDIVVIGVGGSSFTTKVNVSNSVWLKLSVTLIVNVVKPKTLVGVPEIDPVLVLNVNPVGRLGLIE